MKLFNIHLFLFILLFTTCAMSISLQPSVVAHHGDKAGCRGGRRQWPNNGNQNGTTNNSTAAGGGEATS